MFRSMDRVAHCTGWTKRIYDPDHYKVVSFSSAPIGVPFLQALAQDARFELVWVVTMPDAPSGRGMKMQENVIKSEAWKLGICVDSIATPTKLNPDKSDEGKEFAQWLQSRKPDFLVVIAYGKIIPQPILDIPTLASINVHGSLLPKYRGASPLQSVFLDGENETGITIMRMDAWLDTGDMIDKIKFKIPFDWTVKNVIEKMQSVWPAFLCDTLWKYGKRMLGEVKQNDIEATLCGKIEKENWLIDPLKDSLESIYRKYRAYYLWPKVYFTTPVRVIIEKLVLDERIFEEEKNNSLIQWKGLNKAVIELLVKPEGKKAMGWGEFVNGYMK